MRVGGVDVWIHGHGEIIFGPSKGEKVVLLSLLELADIMTS